MIPSFRTSKSGQTNNVEQDQSILFAILHVLDLLLLWYNHIGSNF